MVDPAHLSLKIVIRCRDYQASRRFYAEILGLNVLQEWEEVEGKGCILGFDSSGVGGWLELYQMTEQDPRHDPTFAGPLSNDKIDIQLQTSRLDHWVAALAEQWPFKGPEDLPWGQRWIQLRDPDNLLVAIYEEVK